MKKHLMNMSVVENLRLHPVHCLLKLTPGSGGNRLPEMFPGQFVQVRVDDSPQTFLRRPISIHYLDREANELWLLIRITGRGTRRMSEYRPGDTVNLILPLGNGFSVPQLLPPGSKLLLIGGGVGAAPMLFWGDRLKTLGFKPVFLLGARSKTDILQLAEFEKIGETRITTDDGSMGEKGLVIHHSILRKERFERIYACGPKPMMTAVAKHAKTVDISCEVSLENLMACGLGACLCCIEPAVKGNVCVCTEGPVFNINQLTWQI
jgi:dihydroorotate dehydrogenase electron transfer subunit